MTTRSLRRHTTPRSKKWSTRPPPTSCPSPPPVVVVKNAKCPPATPCEYADPVAVPRALLTAWNVAMTLFHAALATVTLALGTLDLVVPMYRTVISVNQTRTPPLLIPELVRDRFDVPLTAFVAAFFVMTAIAHFLNATLLRGFYLRELGRCRTPLRWIEYSFTAPLMMTLIAYHMGVRDRAVLFCVGALVASTMPYGLWVEMISRPQTAHTWTRPLHVRLLPWLLGHVPQTAAWIVVILQLYDGAADSDLIPWFVYVILWTQLALFYSFGLATVVSQCMPPDRFYRGELLFQVLSLASKGLLGGLLIANVLMRSRYEDAFEG